MFLLLSSGVGFMSEEFAPNPINSPLKTSMCNSVILLKVHINALTFDVAVFAAQFPPEWASPKPETRIPAGLRKTI